LRFHIRKLGGVSKRAFSAAVSFLKRAIASV
jgi:hypothetical protein